MQAVDPYQYVYLEQDLSAKEMYMENEPTDSALSKQTKAPKITRRQALERMAKVGAGVAGVASLGFLQSCDLFYDSYSYYYSGYYSGYDDSYYSDIYNYYDYYSYYYSYYD